jgi:hypothetical protein
MSSHNDQVSIAPEQVHLAKGSVWRMLPIIGAVLAAAGLGGAFAFKTGHEHEFWFAYLVAWYGCLAIGLGGLFFVILQHLVRAGWSIAVRRLAENVAITLPVLCLVGLPVVLFGMHDLYHWTDTAAVDADVMLSAKKSYLNLEFFYYRIGAYFAIWTLLSVLFYRWSTAGDADPALAVRNADKARGFAAPALFLFAMSLTFAAFDFLMSLDPHWFSTMFGVYYFAGSCLTIHAFLTLVAIFLRKSGYLKGVVTDEHYHDLGKYLFGFTVFYTYIAFSQYFLIWYANIPEETIWFGYRIADDFLPLTLLLCLGRFPIPFFFLLPRAVKRSPKTLFIAATWILLMEFVDMFWLIQPVLAHHHAMESGDHHMTLHVGALDALTIVGVLGVFLAAFGWALGRKALVPVNDPRITESIKFENF